MIPPTALTAEAVALLATAMRSQVGASPVVKTTERLTGQVWQMGSSRHCYAEEVPGITTVEEVQTGQARLDKQLWNWTYRTRVSLGQTV
ncbi:hypothetical protein WJX79_004096 [Trebouxia sp. C0005]